ncbi:MAG: ABC transporter permease [Betaproteobacteria bacterium]|nr:ABC transporter permease [Betaproteobacteria bacterium]
MSSRARSYWAGALARLLPLALVLAAWQAASMSGLLPKAVLPSFGEVAASLGAMLRSGEIVPHTLASFARAGAGFGVAVAGGIVLGILMAQVRFVERAVEPVLLLIYPVPKPALIPLFMIWLGIGDFSKVTVIALACLVPVVIATFNGARGVDEMLLWSARARGTSERRILWRVVLPAALPQIAAGVRTAIAVAIIVLVSSEFISAETGLGYLIFSYGGVGADDAMLAVVIYLAALGYLLDRLYLAGLRRLMAWHAFAH